MGTSRTLRWGLEAFHREDLLQEAGLGEAELIKCKREPNVRSGSPISTVDPPGCLAEGYPELCREFNLRHHETWLTS